MDIVINNVSSIEADIRKKSKYKIINAIVISVVVFIFAFGLSTYKILQKHGDTITIKTTETPNVQLAQCDYILNTNTMKAHKPSCQYVDNINDENRKNYHGTDEELQDKGYSPCKYCQAW